MFPRLLVTPVQVKTGNKCENLLTEIQQIIINFFVFSEMNLQVYKYTTI